MSRIVRDRPAISARRSSIWEASSRGFVGAGRDAISRFTLVGQTESEGKTSDINIGVLMVWRDERGAWKLLARQAFRLG